MDLKDPNLLPFINMLGLGLLGIVAAFGHWFGKRKETKASSPQDVLVNSMTIADSAAISKLAETLRDSTELVKDRGEFEREMLYEAKRTNDYLESIKHLVKRLPSSRREPE